MAESSDRPPIDRVDTRTQADRRPPRPPMPRWVRVFLVIVLVIAAALVISQALGIQHGPGMHGALGDSATGVSQAPSS